MTRNRILAGLLLAALFAAGILLVQQRRVTRELQSDTLLDGIADRDTAAIAALLRRGADVNARERKTGITPLMLAVEIGTPDTVETLLNHGADINARSHASHTALLVALPRRDLRITRMLLDGGADANFRSPEGVTPLAWAARWGDSATVELLLRHGARVAALDGNGNTPLTLARGAGRSEILHLLEQAGARD